MSSEVIEVHTRANSQHPTFRQEGEYYIAAVKSHPTDGKANLELIDLVSKHFSIAKSCIKIKKGKRSRVKLVELTTS